MFHVVKHPPALLPVRSGGLLTQHSCINWGTAQRCPAICTGRMFSITLVHALPSNVLMQRLFGRDIYISVCIYLTWLKWLPLTKDIKICHRTLQLHDRVVEWSEENLSTLSTVNAHPLLLFITGVAMILYQIKDHCLIGILACLYIGHSHSYQCACDCNPFNMALQLTTKHSRAQGCVVNYDHCPFSLLRLTPMSAKHVTSILFSPTSCSILLLWHCDIAHNNLVLPLHIVT